MQTNYKIAIALVAGTALGAAAVQGLHAQAKPPGYVVAEIDVSNQEAFTKEYVPLSGEGARTNRWVQTDGPWRQDRGYRWRATQDAHCHQQLPEPGCGGGRV